MVTARVIRTQRVYGDRRDRRMRRMQGYHVLHTMGWDSFGLPAERAAVRENRHPIVISERSIETFRRQIKRLGFSYDWDREINTAARHQNISKLLV